MDRADGTARPLEELSDEELVRRAGAGVQEAMGVLYDRYQARMYGLALRVCTDEAMAQEAVQDAFVGIWRHAASFDADRGSARTWMLAIAHHRAVNLLRRSRAAVPIDSASSSPPLALVVPDLWGEVSRRLDAASVHTALANLPPLQREAIELAYFRGLTQAQIAQRTEVPIGTDKSRVRLGLQALRAEVTAATRADLVEQRRRSEAVTGESMGAASGASGTRDAPAGSERP